MKQVRFFFWDEPYLFKYCPNQIIRRCLSEDEHHSVLTFCHKLACDGHFGPRKTDEKVLQSGFYWPTLFKDAYTLCRHCARCHMTGRITHKDMMPLTLILEVGNFDLWGIDFIGPFPLSYGNQYILVAIDYVFKWAETIPRTNGNQVVIKFLWEHHFSLRSHFCNRSFEALMRKYSISHKLSTAQGISDRLQDCPRYVSISSCILKTLPSACGVREQCYVGTKTTEFGLRQNW